MKPSLLSKILVLPAMFALTAILSGCGNNPRLMSNKVNVNDESQSSWYDDSYLRDTRNEGDYVCPVQTNIFPVDDTSYGEGEFRVCTHRASVSEILIHGQTRVSDKICVFPAERVDDSHVFFKPDAASGLPWSQCGAPTAAGFFAKFAGVKYNVVFIVEAPDKQAMERCLAMNTPYSCPVYSRGQFRQ